MKLSMNPQLLSHYTVRIFIKDNGEVHTAIVFALLDLLAHATIFWG